MFSSHLNFSIYYGVFPFCSPEIVNCSARTGLDTLAKHFEETAGFDLVFFLPDAEEDFLSYTEFLRYLASKDRAGVAKLVDGTTLFLVPPSQFLGEVLKVVGPERLYGVVLRMPSVVVPSTERQRAMALPQCADHPRLPPQPDYGLVAPRKELPVTVLGHGRVLQGDSNFPKPQYHRPQTGSPAVRSTSQDYAPTSATSNPAVPQGKISLTPELIASLASFLPSNPQTSSAEVPQQHNDRPPAEAAQQQSFRPPLLLAEPGVSSSQRQSVSQSIHPVSSVSQYQPYPPITTTGSHSLQPIITGTQMQDSSTNAYQQAPTSARPLVSLVIPHQSGHVVAPVAQQQQVEAPLVGQRGYGVMPGNSVSGLYNAPALDHNYSSSLAANQVQEATSFSQLQAVVPPAYQRTNTEFSCQTQQLQAASSGSGPSAEEVNEDKNKRYQSTLQFAASLLQQIQHKPQ